MLVLTFSNLRKLQQKIKKKEIICHFKLGKVSMNQIDAEVIKYVRDLNPYRVDWGNICDYMTNKDFLHVTKAVSNPDTTNTCYMLNWPRYVYGTCLYDYEDGAKDIFGSTWKILESDQLIRLHITPGLKGYRILDNPVNKFAYYSAIRFAESFMLWYFGP